MLPVAAASIAVTLLAGSWRAAASILCLGVFLVAAFVVTITGGALITASYYLSLVPMLVALLLGVRWAVWAGVACIACLLTVEVMRRQGIAFLDLPAELIAQSNFRGVVIFELVLLTVAIVYDTLRKIHLRDVTESAARFDALEDHGTDLLFELDASGCVRFLSQEHSDELSYVSSELIGKPLAERVHPDDANQFASDLSEAVMTGRAKGVPIRLGGADGCWTWFELSITAYDSLDKNRRLIVIARDITERLHIDEQLRQSQKMEAVGQLAGGVAHDFNNLLMVTGGYAEELKKRSTNEEDLDAAAEILKATERGQALTRQLLAVCQPATTTRQVSDLNSIVSNVKSMLSRMIGDDISLNLKLDPELSPVFVDPGHIEQILVNVALNARDAMPAGGILLIETRADGDRAVIEVSDTGVGLDHETRERIFEAFFTTKPRGEGTGLGLTIVYSLVKSMDGNIRVKSAPAEGTTITMDLPVTHDRGTTERSSGGQEHSLPGGSETILIVEDREAVLRLLTRALKSVGYKVLSASNGVDGLRVALNHGHEIHLVLTDVVMPQMNGPEMAKRLKEIMPRIRCLFMSGHAEPVGVSASELKGNTLITKPVLPSELCKRVREELDDRSHADMPDTTVSIRNEKPAQSMPRD